MANKVRLFCFTNFNLDFNYQNVIDSSSAEYIIIGKEICPKTGREHHQGFVYFSGARRWRWSKDGVKFSPTVAKLLGNCNCRACDGNLDQNCDYCSKDENVTEFGVKPKQGYRTDLEAIKDALANGVTDVDQICMDNPVLYHQYGRTLNKIEDIALRRKYRTVMTKGIWYWGDTGVGKSHKAFEGFHPDTHYVFPNDGGWWDGYKGQETVIINEFRGSICFSEMLDLCDKFPKTVRRRCREPVPFLAKLIIVTSALPPDEVYFNVCNDSDSIEQLNRRFKVIQLEQKWSEGNTTASQPQTV